MAALLDVGGELGDRVADAVAQLAAELALPTDRIAIVACRDRAAALALVNAFAPEHLELHVTDAAALVPQVRNAGAIFVGPRAATAFGDYAAGTNHVLPTGGSARFGQGLSVSDFVKRVGVVELDEAAVAGLAGPVGDDRRRRRPALARPLGTPADGAVTAAPGRRAVADDPSGAGIAVDLVVDGNGRADVSSGDAFIDHLLGLAARHARFDLTITRADPRAAGGSVVESIAGALGRALAEALGDERGVRRSGSVAMPSGEALALVALDLSGRPYLAYDVDFAGVRIDEFDADLARRFLRALVEAAGMTLHVRLLSGSDPHHIVDAVFAGLGEALRTACERLA